MSKIVLHTKITGEIFLSIFKNNVKLGEIPLGTDPKAARQKARDIKDAVGNADDFTDQIT
ncbi:MAG: hypothetical protein RBT70_08850 [Alphaproteobacteria bacterium]|jgi:hypothetical protein|nr:hypothetical protein [Alphaproteobacteria bacterium]